MQQYYLHNQFINNGIRKNIKPIKINNKNLICMSNDNAVEFYEYTSNGIRYHSKLTFNCTIAKLEILPTKRCINNDYLFIVDKIGRYAFWYYDGFEVVENQINLEEGSLYKTEDDLDQVSYSGEIHHFDVFDTKGSVFFAISHTIVVIDYAITRLGIKIEKPRKLFVPYVQYRFINWVKSSKKGKHLGIIEEIQERTVLRVHNIEACSKINEENQVFKYEKLNLFDFISENEELLLISDDQISGHSINKAYQQIYAHKIHKANGKLICLNKDVYCYVSENLLAFNKGSIKSYGSFSENGVNIFEKKGVYEAHYLKETEDKGAMICVSTLNNQTYFITLYQNAWKLYYHLKALTSLYSVHPTANKNSLIAVMDQSEDQYQVVSVERQSSVPLTREQKCPIFIDKLMSVQQGRYIVICSQQSNLLMKYNEGILGYEKVSELPKENIFLISSHIMITGSALYAVSLQSSYFQELARESIILGSSNQDKIVYMNGEGEVKMINLTSNDIVVVRSNAFDEYSWHLCRNNDFIVAKSSNLRLLTIYHDDGNVSEISLLEECVISSIFDYSYENDSEIEEMIAIGYMNGSLYLYSKTGEMKAKFNDYCHQPIIFFPMSSNFLGIISGSKQFILSPKNNIFILNQIELSKSENKITSVAFCQLTNQFIFVESDDFESGKLIRMIQFSNVYKGLNTAAISLDSYRIKTISQNFNQIPTVFIYNSFILVGINSALHIYQLQSGRLLRTLTHYLKDVLGMFELQCGLVMYGIDSIERNLIYVYSVADFEELCMINFILKDNKYIKTLKGIPNTNRFLCRGETFTSLCQLNFPKQINEILEFKTILQGYSLQIDPEHSILGETDSKRLLLVFTYSGNMLPIARYVCPSQINDFILLSRCILIGDKAGYLHLLQFNTEDPNQALRMTMTKVASINVGEQVTALTKRSPTEAFYATVSGRIGSIQIIGQQLFTILKPAEEHSINASKNRCDFDYSCWRGRNGPEDKLVDGSLIKKYLQENSKRMLNENDQEIFREAQSFLEKLSI